MKHFDNLIINCTNKTKITWNIIKTLTNKRNNHKKIDSMKINSKLIKDPDVISQSFNQFFSTIAHSSINQHPSKEIVENSLLNLRSSTSVKTPTFYFNPTSQYEINKISQSKGF